MIILINSFLILYFMAGLLCSFYGTSFFFIGGLWEKEYKGVREKFDWFMIIYFYVCITAIWPGFAIVLAVIHRFDKTMIKEMNIDFELVVNHHFGEIYNIGID